MARYLAGVGSVLLLAMASFFIWQARADRAGSIPAAPAASTNIVAMGVADLAPPLQATERTREQKRFARYDKDRNGAVARDEYLAGRHKGFDKLDLNRDGKLSFDEYAIKAVTKFAAADQDRNGVLNAPEFATTRVIRKSKPKPKCPPSLRAQATDDAPAEES